MEQRDHTTTNEAPAGEVVRKDRPCLNCGYNLKGLPPSGLCPECGTKFAGTRGEEFAGDWPTRYLGRLRLGAILAQWGLLIVSGAGFTLASLGLVPWIAWNARWAWLLTISGIAVVAGIALVLVGLWLITTRPGGAQARFQSENVQFVLRSAVVILAVSPLSLFLLLLPDPEFIATMLMLVAGICLFIVYFGSLRYLWFLGQWIRSSRVRRGGMRMMWLGPAMIVGAAAAASAIYAFGQGSALADLFAWTAWFGGWVVLWGSLAWLFELVRRRVGQIRIEQPPERQRE